MSSSSTGTTSPSTGSTPAYHNNTDALGWLDLSAEQHALYVQAFELARLRVEAALNTLPPTARPCVFSDLDETLLDNSAYNAWLVRHGRDFNEYSWDKYCRERLSKATAGALAFTQYLRMKRVEIFYVTSRHDRTRKETAENLYNLGFPVDLAADAVPSADPWLTRLFMKGFVVSSAPGGDRKFEQYRYVERERGFTPLLWLGDNLHDFHPDFDGKSRPWKARLDSASVQHAQQWGTKWIVMPNPVYGDWQLSRWKDSFTPENRCFDDGYSEKYAQEAIKPGPSFDPNRRLRDKISEQNARKMRDLDLWAWDPDATAP